MRAFCPAGCPALRRAHGVAISTFVQKVDAELYARARATQADVHFDDLADLAEDVKEGRIQPQAGRVVADIIKWRVARMRPKAYGDKVAHEHTGTIDLADAINAARQRLKERG